VGVCQEVSRLALALLDLDHPADVRELERAAHVVEVVHVERRVLGGELDVVVVAGLTDQLDERRPGRQDVGAQRGLAGGEALTESVATHGSSPVAVQ
jgi:hypothetical protein